MASDQNKYVRGIDDVDKIIKHAKLEESALLPVTQSLYFADNTTQYKLLELNSELLNKLKSGIQITFRGNKDDKAVLCSDTVSYEVKEAETSNSLLLISNLKFPDELKSSVNEGRSIEHKNVIGVFHKYYEVKPCKPKLRKLRAILEDSSYRGSELESELIESGVKMYSFSELLDVIQASEFELKNALNDLYAFQLKGVWRLLDFSYHTRVLTYFLNLIDEQSWKYDDISADEVVEMLSDIVPIDIINYILSTYCETSSLSDGKRCVKLIEDRVCRILGEELLRSIISIELSDFLRAWQETVLEGLTTNLRQLEGLYYIDNKLNRKVIHYCPEHDLSEDISERIKHLFKLKEKWTFDEIRPYIEIFTTDKMDANAILTKYARASKTDGVQMYSSRHGK